MTESATDRFGCWPAWFEPAWGELPSSLRDATFAEVDIRAADHMSHLGLKAAAGAALDRTYGSGGASSDARVALDGTSLNRHCLKLYGIAMCGAT